MCRCPLPRGRLALRGPPGWVAVALACTLATAAASQASFRGRALVDVLEEFRRGGLNLIFSTAVVGSDLVIVEEPTGDDPRHLLDQILPQLGLKAEAGPGGSILIVRGPRVDAPPADPPLPQFIEDIVVIPSRREVVERSVEGTRHIDATAADLVPVPGSDPSRMVSLLPGVATTEASATFHARGSASRDASLILDGLELYDPYHLSGFQSPFSFVDGRLVDSVDLVAGGFTADRGDRTGGFLAIATASPNGQAETELELGTLNGRVAFKAPTPVGPVVVSGRYWYPTAAEDVIAFAEDGLQPKFGDVYVKAGLLTTPRTVLTAHALLASESASLTEPDGHERVEADGSSASLWVRVIRSWSESLTMDTVVSAGRMSRARTGIADPDDQPVRRQGRSPRGVFRRPIGGLLGRLEPKPSPRRDRSPGRAGRAPVRDGGRPAARDEARRRFARGIRIVPKSAGATSDRRAGRPLGPPDLHRWPAMEPTSECRVASKRA